MMARNLLALAHGIGALIASCVTAAAQGLPMPPASVPGTQSQTCVRLESQLAAIDRGPLDPARASQIHRYEDAISKQQQELDRVVVRLRQTGCESSGFFSLFSGQSASCGPLNQQVQQMRANIDRMLTELQRVQGNTADRESQRRSVLIALSQNDCGPQYRAASASRANNNGGFFDSLFGPGSIVSPPPTPGDVPQSSTYRTVCVRTCDGFYWPISFSTVPSRFGEDERTCQRMCPAAAVQLYTHRNPGEDMSQAVSLSGQPYSELPNAFLYRKQYSAACSCRHAGETWAHALGNVDDTIERGDIVVTEERAKQMSKAPQPRAAKPARGKGKAAEETPPPSAPAKPAATAKGAANASEDGEHKVRSVGPTFLPNR
jgi:hypothetical protein